MNITEYIPLKPHSKLDLPRDSQQDHLAGPITFRRGSKMILSGKSKKNPFINFGGNRQNMDDKLKRLRVADKGYKLIKRDLSGADAVIVSLLCRQGPYRELFQNGIRPHSFIALKFFPDVWRSRFDKAKVDIALNTPIPELNRLNFWKDLNKFIKSSNNWDATERYDFFGKKSGLSFNYGMQPQRFVDSIFEETEGMISIPLNEGARWSFTYHNLFPEIQSQFQFGTIAYAKRNGCLRNLLGWPFNFTKDPEKLNGKDLNELYSWIPQSTVATVILMALVEMQEYIETNDRNWHILNEVHDEILTEAPKKEAEECGSVLGEFMKKELTSPIDGFKFKMTSECKIGYNYGDYHEKDNPEGMQAVSI